MLTDSLMVVGAPLSTVRAVDCGKYSDERGDPECERRSDMGIGVMVVAAVLILAISYAIWRRKVAKLRNEPTSGSGSSTGEDGSPSDSD